MAKNIKNEKPKCPIESKEEEMLEKYQKERRDEETLKNLLIFSDKDYTSSSAAEYFKIKAPAIFRNLFQDKEFKSIENLNKPQNINKLKDIQNRKAELGNEDPFEYEYFDDSTRGNNNDIRNGVQDIISNIFNEKKDKTVEVMNKIIENETNDNLLKNGF